MVREVSEARPRSTARVRRGAASASGPAGASGAPSRAPRRDALRNRALLIETAAAAFREEGLQVGVDEIARRANVGIATLYRHFPTKGDLVVAVSSELLDELRAARDAARDAGDDAAALERFLRDALAQLQANRGMVEALAQHPPSPQIRERMREEMLEVVEPVVEQAHAAGTLARGLDAEDLLIAIRMIGAASAPGTPREPERYLRLLLAGLREGC
jgi:AcrR family transcriptional regulator